MRKTIISDRYNLTSISPTFNTLAFNIFPGREQNHLMPMPITVNLDKYNLLEFLGL